MGAWDFSWFRSSHCLGCSRVCHYEGIVVVLSPVTSLRVAVEVIVEAPSYIELEMFYPSFYCHQKWFYPVAWGALGSVNFPHSRFGCMVISVKMLNFQIWFSNYWREEVSLFNVFLICPPWICFQLVLSIFRSLPFYLLIYLGIGLTNVSLPGLVGSPGIHWVLQLLK